MKYLVLFLLMIGQMAYAAQQEIDDHHWTGVERIVAIGDIHGDYPHYIATLEATGLVNSRGKWVGGSTHLVQTGDIPDRGPDTLKIIEHLEKLALEARKKGGRVHNLIGNHEAMNVFGDLSYVTAGEYEAFVDRKSASLRDRYFDVVMQNIQQQNPEGFAQLPVNFREEWDKEHPLGWLEHRQAWNSAWNPDAKLFKKVLEQKTAIQINDIIFLHGGISSRYCQNSLQSMTEMVVSNLRAFDPGNPGILLDEFGPLWYRGLAGVEPVAATETVEAILEHHGARYIVIGHTPTSGVIWPRYDGRVIQIDTGISDAYGGHVGYLEVTQAGLFAGYLHNKIELPEDDSGRIRYLEEVIKQDPDNPYLLQRLENLTTPDPIGVELEIVDAEPGQGEVLIESLPDGEETIVVQATIEPICGISE